MSIQHTRPHPDLQSSTPLRAQLQPLTCGRHPPWVSSHCKQARLPVAAASCAGFAPLLARQFPSSPASSTRNRRQVSFPARAAWWTGEAPNTSLTSGVSAFCANCNLSVCTSPCLAASSAASPSGAIACVRRPEGTRSSGEARSPGGRRRHCVCQASDHPARTRLTFAG